MRNSTTIPRPDNPCSVFPFISQKNILGNLLATDQGTRFTTIYSVPEPKSLIYLAETAKAGFAIFAYMRRGQTVVLS